MTTDQTSRTDQDPRPDEAAQPAGTIDMDTLMAFVGQAVGDLGATMAAGNVVLGDRLGLYRVLARGATDAGSLAAATGTDPRYVEEWLRGQAAGGYVEHDAATSTYSLTPEKAFALTDPDGPVFLPGAFELALGALRAEPRVAEAFRTGGGHRLARARPGRVRRLRALLPARLPHAPADRVDPGPRRASPTGWSAAPTWPTSAAATGRPPC